MNRCNANDGHFDSPSFWAGTFVGIMVLLLLTTILFAVGDDDYLIGVPDACQYAEDLCYPEYSNGQWRIVQGER